MSKIKMNDLWENYGFVLKKNGDKSNEFTTVKVKDFFGNIELSEDEKWEDAPEEAPRATIPWGEDVETITLPSGLTIAKEDYYEIDEDGDKKTEFTWDEAMEIEKKTGGKWRVPTQIEWLQICTELGGKDGALDRDTLVRNLNLTEDEDGYGAYWSSTAYNAASAYYLAFYSSSVYPGTYYVNKYLGFTVRCVAGSSEPRESDSASRPQEASVEVVGNIHENPDLLDKEDA